MTSPGGPSRSPSPAALAGYLGPPAALMALIFFIGTDRTSAGETRTLIERLIQQLWPSFYARLTPETLVVLNVAFRKLGHFGGYGLLGLLDVRAIRGLAGPLNPRKAVLAWLAAVTWAAVDEFHQSFFPTRGASPVDVLIDGAGAALSVSLYWLWHHSRTPTSS